MRVRRLIGIFAVSLLAAVLPLAMAVKPRAAAQAPVDAIIRQTMEAAMNRWRSEHEGVGYYYRELETFITVDAVQLAPPSPETGTTQTLWWRGQYGQLDQDMFSETIYNLSSEARAQQRYNQVVIDNAATPGPDFHGLPAASYYMPEALDPSLVWTYGNLVFVVQDQHPPRLAQIIEPHKPLQDYLYEEAVKNGLIVVGGSRPAPGGQAPAQPPAANVDTDQDGFADTRDVCKTQPAPQSADGCPPYSVIIQCGPEEPEEGETIACTAEASGSPDGDSVEFEWEVDGTPQGTGVASQWKAGKSSHTVTVRARGKPSGRQGNSTITILIRGAITKPVDDPTSNIVITNLGCSTDMTSDESMDCLVGFKRLDSKIKELVVIWHVDGKRASTSTRMDDGDTYSLRQPAPGVHTIMVFVGDPNNAGRGRVMTTTARILPGLNAQKIPAGAGAGAAAGTLLGIGGWLWAQWWFAKQGSGPVSKAISRLPTTPRVDRSYSGIDAKTILDQLGIFNGLKGLDASDFTAPEFRARLEELLDTHFGKRKVKGIHYKVGADGEIDINSIEIVVEEAEDAPHPREMRPPKPAKNVKPPIKPPVTKPPVTQPPTTKPPVRVPPVDPKELELRKRWQAKQKDFVEKQRDLSGARAVQRVAARAVDNARTRVDAEIATQKWKGMFDALSHSVQTGVGLVLIDKMPALKKIGFDWIWNAARQGIKDYIFGEERSLLDHASKLTGVDPYVQDIDRLLQWQFPNRLPAGLLKDVLKVVAERVESSRLKWGERGWGLLSRWTNFYAQNSGRSQSLQEAMDRKKELFDWSLDMGSEVSTAKANRDSAQRHVQYAWDAYQEYLRNKRSAGAR